MSLSEPEKTILAAAGSDPSPVARQRAVGVVRAKQGNDAHQANKLLVQSFLEHVRPSFHLIPKGDSMANEESFTLAYSALAAGTDNFTVVSEASLQSVLLKTPEALGPLRMIVGLTHNELAVAIRLLEPDARVNGDRLKKFERSSATSQPSEERDKLAALIAATATAVMSRDILSVPSAATGYFHSKLDKRDTTDGWVSVQRDSKGVPYSALLYQRYVGGVWRQVQDAYSEVKGDAVLEHPLRDLLDAHAIPYHHTRRGATGARETVELYGMSPGPDFVIPDESPTLVIESKVAEDGGTARDKAARIRTMTSAARERSLKACVLIDGKGWIERTAALLDVIIATEGRTYTLTTLDHILELPEIRTILHKHDANPG